MSPPDPRTGRRAYVSDMVEAVLSNLAPILTNETLIQFEAAGEEDEEQARLESDFVAYMVAGQNKGFVQILSAIKGRSDRV